jgi:hypothetical protein
MSQPRGPWQRDRRLNVGAVMLMIAGAALGFWLIVNDLRRIYGTNPNQQGVAFGGADDSVMLVVVYTLGGVSLVGVPLLLWRTRAHRWGAGRLLWFTQGTASWLLWPPIVYRRAVEGSLQHSISAICFLYGTPIMAVYVTLTLLAGGYFSRSARRRMARSWQEIVGLVLGLLWACTGLYLLSLYYRNDFARK